tara:strand:- start:1569 stop:2126 length:558 start_codon:yes stop_codon:yes gene_type:complete
MVASLTAISGPYTGSWNGIYLGVTEDGYELEHTFYSEPVRGDNLGDSIQDEVLRGQDVYVNYTLIEHNKGIAAPSVGQANSSIHWPTGISGFNAVGANGQVGVIGDTLSEYASSLVLTAQASTPAAASPASITFPGAILARNFPIRVLYASRLRRIPIRMVCLPVAGGTGAGDQYSPTIYYYTTT